MAEPEPAGEVTDGASQRFLTFRMADRLYALPADEVTEVIRTPAVARVPQGPDSLLGVANLRGEVLPVASLRGLLGQAAMGVTASSRALVLSGAAPVALVVDAVDALVTVGRDQIETTQTLLAAQPGERLTGAFRRGDGEAVAKVLDIRGLLADAFVQRARPARLQRTLATAADTALAAATADQDKLITFEAAGQEFGLGLEAVREIIPAPGTLALVPHSEALVLGVAPYRDTLLPMFSLRGLLGLPQAAWTPQHKVVVTAVAGVLVGLVVDRMRAIIPVDPERAQPTPPVLAARTGGETRIKALYRGEDGRRLISILDPKQLFREEVMQRLGQTASGAADTAEATGATDEALKFLVFRLGEDEFALPIGVVDEVAQVPTRITRLPKTPAFLEGVINLRGEVLPVIDQRRRFDMPSLADPAGRRLVVVRTERHRAGLIVDSVSQVLSSRLDALEEAPDLAGESTRLVQGVINLDAAGRIVLVLDPAELLSRAERGLLDRFKVDAADVGGEKAGAEKAGE